MRRLLFIDTETGGLDASRHSILSLGAVVWSEGRLVDTFETLILEPKFVVEKEALEINRIDLDQHRIRGVAPAVAMKEFIAFLERHFEDPRSGEKIRIAGHNVGFDIAFLKRLCRLSEVRFEDFFSHRSLDTASVIAFLSLAEKVPLASAGSSEAFEYFGIEFGKGQRHRAVADARATALLLNKLLERVVG